MIVSLHGYLNTQGNAGKMPRSDESGVDMVSRALIILSAVSASKRRSQIS